MICLIYEDREGYCRIVKAKQSFQHEFEADDNAIARLHQVALKDVTEFLACDESKIPTDKTFRDAWKKGDQNEPIKIDFEKALSIHRERLKEASETKIQHYRKELELCSNNIPKRIAIEKTIELLLKMHKGNLTHCKTVQDIKIAIPKELKNVWTFYALR